MKIELAVPGMRILHLYTLEYDEDAVQNTQNNQPQFPQAAFNHQ